MKVKWGDCFSQCFQVSNGVRQGSVLSPYLFSVYMDDLSRKLNKMEAGCLVGNEKINHLMYADDLCCFCPSMAGLRDLVDICSHYAISHDIIFNAKKSVGVLFHVKFCKNFKPDLWIAGKLIDFVNSVKYLGVFLTNNLSDDLDVMRQVKYLYAAGNTLRSKFSRCSDRSLFLFVCISVVVFVQI